MRWKSVKSCVIYWTEKKFACISNCRYCVDRAQNLPGPAPTICSKCSRFHPNRFTFGGDIRQDRLQAYPVHNIWRLTFYSLEEFCASSPFPRLVLCTPTCPLLLVAVSFPPHLRCPSAPPLSTHAMFLCFSKFCLKESSELSQRVRVRSELGR